MLDATRDQKFRKLTESQIQGYESVAQKQKQRWTDPLKRQKHSQTLSKVRQKDNRTQSAETRKKISEAVKKKFQSVEIRDKMSGITKKRWLDPEFRKKYEEGIKRRVERGPTQKQKEGYKKNGLKQRKKITTPFGEYDSLTICASELNLVVGSVQSKMKDMPHLYFYTDEGPGNPTFEKVWHTPYGKTNNYNKSLLMKNAGVTIKPNYKFREWFKENNAKDPSNWFVKEEIRQEWGIRRNNKLFNNVSKS